ncbi:MAG: prolipoprotein diacylglyceryl transferase [Bacteriovoracaceae bacterium]|nr:prolipoprotein diacylglyceryl transferase [Bacteriovoracaceae bacterium]
MLPILFSSGDFVIYSYPLFMGIAWGVSYYFTKYLLEKDGKEFQHYNFFFFSNFIFAYLGAKIFFLLFSAGELIPSYATNSLFWLGGGFVFYGGFLFALLFSLFYVFILKKISFSTLVYFIPSLTLAHAIGRVGCFFAGCCYGKFCDLPWAIDGEKDFRHPVQLYEAFLLICLFFYLLRLLYKKASASSLFFTYLLGYSFFRFILEFFRGDFIRGVGFFSTSQYISLSLFFCSLLLFLKNKTNICKK